MAGFKQGWSMDNEAWGARLIVREVAEPDMVYLAISTLDERELKGIMLTKEQFHELMDLYYRIKFREDAPEAPNV